jgi:hypothetical protein
MAPIRVTISLNTNQSLKAPLLLPVDAPRNPDVPKSCRSLVLNAAKAKLRLKKPTRIFVAGTGQEVESEEDWESILKSDIVLLASGGEDYVGLRKEKGEMEGEWNALTASRNNVVTAYAQLSRIPSVL